MRTLCASTLIAEFIVIGLAALAATRLTDVSAGTGTVWTVSGVAMALCLLLCGLADRPGFVQLGWTLQAALIAGGLVLPVLFLLGGAFAALWWASIHYGRRVDEIKAARAGAEAAAGTG
ncbi:DUF4233 domain-containing protein [Streptomyces sp. NBC_01803]|uniref:DUF4233 domain-containing protein n=1 Tax=Streptomyces sp. NBC_01803 TaxID=2975946 RepID=UPI002DDAF188|nr:DUF4233 domain-containing protein [Streptomyces sp. NBC_01803]WSA46221.1 DUF4233 domain-containing protein [Streptomyces sp. NBC_01803]